MKLMERIANAISVFKAPPVEATSSGPSVFSLGGRNTASSTRPNQSNLADSLSRYADEAWVYSCVRIIMTKGSEVPLKVYKMVNGKKTHLPDHPLQKLLDAVNPFMDRSQLMEGSHGFKELTGNAYWLLDAFVAGKPTEIHLLNPAYVKPVVTKEAGLVGYEYRINGQLVQTFAPEEIVHFRYWNPLDPFCGQPPISAGRDGADMIKKADQYNIAFFNNSAEAGGFLTTDKMISDDNITRIKKNWASNHLGARKAHKIEILHGGMKWQANTATHAEMMFPELKRMSREDVLGCYMVPPCMVGVFDEANYSNADVQERIFWKFMKARLASFDSVLTERLGKPYDGVIIAHDLSGVQELQEDTKFKAAGDKMLVEAGIKTINEVRAENNQPPVPWGDAWWSPFGLTPVDSKPEISITPPPVPDAAPKPPALPPPEPPAGKRLSVLKDAPAAPAATPDPRKEFRDQAWLKYKGLTDSLERKWAGPVRSLFNGQEREVIENLRGSDWKKTVNQNRLDKMRNVKSSVEAVLFDRSHSRKVFRKTAQGLMEVTIQESADKEIRDYDLGIDFDLSNPQVTSWIQTKSFKFAEEVNSTTEDMLRTQLEEAIKAGETISEVENRIAEVFDIARGSRTAMIARTEVISASNEGAMASYKQSGVVDSTEWVSSRDDKVRDEHQIDGETVKLDESFSNGLRYPGDPEGEPGNTINCRCTIAPITKDE